MASDELRVFQIKEEVYTSRIPPMVTHGLVSSRWPEMERMGYDEVTIATFGNVWTRTRPLDDLRS